MACNDTFADCGLTAPDELNAVALCKAVERPEAYVVACVHVLFAGIAERDDKANLRRNLHVVFVRVARGETAEPAEESFGHRVVRKDGGAAGSVRSS
jgi:hypothetical protein